MILWDSKKRGGRPDTVKLLKETWDSFGAEVIFITSNKQGNDEMMQGCRAGTLLPLTALGGKDPAADVNIQPDCTRLALCGTFKPARSFSIHA
jgi:hypothetical protein